MMDEYITRNNAISAVCFGCNQQFSDEPCEPSECTIRQSIMALPTADVVPKSDEGAECPTCHGTGRIGTTDWLTKNISKEQLAKEKAEAIAEHELHIKQDYAREIFEEIENSSSIIIAGIRHYVICEYELAELKKKYKVDCPKM